MPLERMRIYLIIKLAMLIYVWQDAAAKQAAWEQEQARIARERHLKEVEEFKASEALAGAAVARVTCDM